MNITLDGHSVFAATGGLPLEAARAVGIFLHGAGMDHSVFALQARRLAHRPGHASLAPDLPGHGRSTGPPLNSIEALADWLARLTEALGLEKILLIGHSMGALIALEAAAGPLHSRVKGLALLGAAARMAVHPELMAEARANSPGGYERIIAWGFGRAGHIGPSRLPGMRNLEAARAVMALAGAGVLAADLSACDHYLGAMAAAARIAIPTVVVIGRDDRMTPAKLGAALASLVPGAQTVTLATGHMMMVEEPEDTFSAIAQVLSAGL